MALHGAQGTNFQWDHVAAGACRRERSIARLPWGSQTATFDGGAIQFSDIGKLSAILALACAAILSGYRSSSAIAARGRNYGAGLIMALGFGQSTLSRREPTARLDADPIRCR